MEQKRAIHYLIHTATRSRQDPTVMSGIALARILQPPIISHFVSHIFYISHFLYLAFFISRIFYFSHLLYLGFFISHFLSRIFFFKSRNRFFLISQFFFYYLTFSLSRIFPIFLFCRRVKSFISHFYSHFFPKNCFI